MQVKELLKMLDFEEKELTKQINQDEWNIRNRNSILVRKFYTEQISLNEKRIKDIKITIQVIIMHVSVEDQPD